MNWIVTLKSRTSIQPSYFHFETEDQARIKVNELLMRPESTDIAVFKAQRFWAKSVIWNQKPVELDPPF